MIDYASTHFPITGEALAAMQERELGRKLRKYERKFLAEMADMVNEIYMTAAATGNIGNTLGMMNAVNTMGGDDFEEYLKGFTLGWLMLAAVKGVEAHDKARAQEKAGKGATPCS